MSTVENTLLTGNQSITNYDNSFIFLRDNKYESGTFTAGGALTLEAGTVLGRVTATGVLAVCASGLANGAQIPVGILTREHIFAGAGSETVNFCTAGEVASEKLVFDGSDTLDTDFGGRRLRDRIAGDTAGIILVDGIENTLIDNQ